MKILTLFSLLAFTLASPLLVSAQGMMGRTAVGIDDDHTAQEEAEGKEIWQKL